MTDKTNDTKSVCYAGFGHCLHHNETRQQLAFLNLGVEGRGSHSSCGGSRRLSNGAEEIVAGGIAKGGEIEFFHRKINKFFSGEHD